MRFLLDTDTCIYLLKGEDPALAQRVLDQRREDVGISAITLGELELGVAKSEHAKKNRRRLEVFSSNVTALPFDADAAVAYGRVRAALEKAGTPIGPLDTLIAAHAIALGSTLVTNNEREFGRVSSLRIANWSTPRAGRSRP